MKLLLELSSELNRLFLFELEDGQRVEAVFYRGDTLCVSTQVGCAVGCPFCLSGREGLIRNLSHWEIVGQYEALRERLPVKRIAFAGIGEPLMNFKNVLMAYEHFKRYGLGTSFYTTGFPVENLRKLLHLPHKGVSISLHSLREDIRKRLLPHVGSLQELIKALREELPRLSSKRRSKVSLAWLLLKGINDTEEELRSLAHLAKELGVGITLLRYNRTVENFEDVDDKDYEKAFLLLRSYGVRVTLSTRFRKDKLGGCGTLRINRSLVGV
ncbi:MAG: radical SAM protein [Aquificota bacterium]|nr:MAG: radical SAM protein [Aquificota bacterium]